MLVNCLMRGILARPRGDGNSLAFYYRGKRGAGRQGLIQAAAALLHQACGNRHGTVVVGAAALAKLAGPQRPDIEFETVNFRAQLARALAERAIPRAGIQSQ